jgi:hypothetical protein
MRIALLLSGLALAACSGQTGGNGSGNGTAQQSGGSSASAEASWNAADACALLPKEVVEEAVGQPVTGTQLSRASAGTADTAAMSQCTYSFAGGKSLDFFARRSPVPDNNDAAMKQTRDSMTEAMGVAAEEVPNLGKNAFWVSRGNQLHVFIGEDRYIYFMAMNAPAGADLKAAELALARRIAT